MTDQEESKDAPPADPNLVELDEATTEALTRSVPALNPREHHRHPTLCIPRAYAAVCAEATCGAVFYSPGVSRCPSCGSSEWVQFEKIDRARAEGP